MCLIERAVGKNFMVHIQRTDEEKLAHSRPLGSFEQPQRSEYIALEVGDWSLVQRRPINSGLDYGVRTCHQFGLCRRVVLVPDLPLVGYRLILAASRGRPNQRPYAVALPPQCRSRIAAQKPAHSCKCNQHMLGIDMDDRAEFSTIFYSGNHRLSRKI